MAKRMPKRPPPGDLRRSDEDMRRRVGSREARKIKARRTQTSIWFGLGTFGIIGWSVAIPILLGILLGTWIDNTWPSRYSWTLMLLLGGVILGCLNAWVWIERERKLIEEKEEPEGDGNEL
jgi:ATP synthase protein I